MKTIHAILTLIIATLFVSAFTFAAEPEIERQIQLKVALDDELIDVDASDLEIGGTRQSFTESGKEVLVTRTPDGFQIEVDGEEIELGVPGGEGHQATFLMTGGDDAKVIVRTLEGDEGGHGYAFIHADGDHHWVQQGGDGEDVDVTIERVGPAEHLLASGVLDDLDEETRQKILATLREMKPHQRIHKQVIVEKVHEDSEN